MMKSARVVFYLLILLVTASLSYSQNYVESFDGVKIAYEEYGEGETTLLFVHCWMCNKEFWRNQIDVFGEDYHIVTLDLAGHGESGNDRDPWSVTTLAKDVVAVADELGLEKIILVGHSMGGPVSLFAADMLGERVIGIVGVDNFQNVEQVATEEQLEQFVAPMKADFENTVYGFVAQGLFPQGSDSLLVKEVAGKMAGGNSEAGIMLMEEMYTTSAKPILAKIKVPIVIIYGDMYPINFAALESATASADSIMINGVGHFPHLEKPNDFNTLLKKAIAVINTK